MQHPGFFQRGGPFPLRLIAETVGAELVDALDGGIEIDDLRPLTLAGDSHLTFCTSRKYAGDLAATQAGACLIKLRDASLVPDGAAAVTTEIPHRAFALAVGLLYPEVLQPRAAASAAAVDGVLVHSTAEIAEGVTLEPGAIVGREARDRHGHDCRRRCRGRLSGVYGQQLLYRPGRDGDPRVDRRPRDLPCGRAHRAGRIRLRHERQGPPQSAAGRPRDSSATMSRSAPTPPSTAAPRRTRSSAKAPRSTTSCRSPTTSSSAAIASSWPRAGIAGSAELGDFVIMGAHSGIVEHVKVGYRRADRRHGACEGRRRARRAHGRDAGAALQGLGARASCGQAPRQERPLA